MKLNYFKFFVRLSRDLINITHIESCSAAGDFNEYGALIANLDLVISASNAALMLASRLGKEAWEFLPGLEKRVDKNLNNWLWHHSVNRFYKGETTSWDEVLIQMREKTLEKLNH